MKRLTECVHEREVLDLVLSDRWPDRCDPDMVAHAAACAVCADLISVSPALRPDGSPVEPGLLPPSQWLDRGARYFTTSLEPFLRDGMKAHLENVRGWKP